MLAHLLLAALLCLAGCGKPHSDHPAKEPEAAAISVRTQRVETKPIAAYEEVVGTVRAKLRATIEAKASGRILQMPALLGQSLTNGQLLVRLEAPEIQARLDQAGANLQQAERDSKRISSLFDQQAATRSDYESAHSRFLVAKGTLAEAQAMMGYVEVQAPFAGVVTRKWVDVGDQATPGKPLLEIEDPSRLQLDADVPEAVVARIKPGAQMSIRADHSAGDLSGTVVEMAPTADPASRTFRVKLDLTPVTGIMSGQFARLIVPVGETPSMLIPASAVLQRGQMDIVFVVEDQRARLHLVKTGRAFNHEIEILSGLDSGDLIVIHDPQQLSDGQPVQGK